VAILPPMYAELGISLSVIGLIFMAARFFDVFTDPVFGVLGDRVRTRWGRRRPAIALGLPIILVGAYPLFFPAQPTSEISLLIALLVMYAGWTLLMLAHTAWASELSSDYDQRSRIMGTLQICGLAGAVVVLAIPAAVEYVSPDATMVMRGQAMGSVILITLPVLFIVALFAVDEPKIELPAQPKWREGLRSIATNLALRRLLLADLMIGIQGGINGSIHFFFIIHVLLLPQAASLFLVAIFLVGFLCVLPFVKLAKRFGKHQTLCFVSLQSASASVCLFFLPSGAFWPALLVYLMIGVSFGSNTFLMRSMMADVIDQDRVNTGAERSALYYSMLTLTAKLGAALAVGFTFPILDWVGFDAKIVNDPATLDGVRMVAAISPTVLILAVAVIMWNFPIGRKEQRELREQIKQANMKREGEQ